jgi:hypothetical protein
MSKSDRPLRLFTPGKFFLYSTKNKINIYLSSLLKMKSRRGGGGRFTTLSVGVLCFIKELFFYFYFEDTISMTDKIDDQECKFNKIYFI